MTTIVFMKKFEKADADRLLKQCRAFFAANPRRRVIRVGLGGGLTQIKVVRGKEVEAVKEVAVDGWTP